MNIDIALAVASGLINLFLTWFCVDYELKKQRKKFALVLIGAGVLGLVLIGVSTYRSVKASGDIDAKMGQIKDLQTQLDNKVTIIEENTSKPVVVNVPPPSFPVQRAVVILSKTESALVQKNNGARILMEVGKPVVLNFHFVNVGQSQADNNKIFARIYVVPSNLPNPSATLAERFKKEAKADMAKHSGLSLPPGGISDVWNSGWLDRNIEADDITKLNAGTELMYIFLVETYKDPAGEHYHHYCLAVQPPPPGSEFSLDVLHYCATYNDIK